MQLVDVETDTNLTEAAPDCPILDTPPDDTELDTTTAAADDAEPLLGSLASDTTNLGLTPTEPFLEAVSNSIDDDANMTEEYSMIPSPTAMSRTPTPPPFASNDVPTIIPDLDLGSLFPEVEQAGGPLAGVDDEGSVHEADDAKNQQFENPLGQDDIPERPRTPADQSNSRSDELDLLNSIPNMYRLLDLVLEQGSGGLVDKVIIAQESLSKLMNRLCPGVYVSLTKIDFKTLDSRKLKLIGAYGSKSALVKFLKDVAVVDDDLATLLLKKHDSRIESSRPHLRSGLYFVLDPAHATTNPARAFVIYWPEEETWNDDASSSVCKNRVTFMRYLSKLTDQTMALISPEHSRTLVWNDEQDAGPQDDEDDSAERVDRMFTFEVAKTKEEEESIAHQPGFTVYLPSIAQNPQNVVDGLPSQPPILIPGETQMGFMTHIPKPATIRKSPFCQTLHKKQIELYLQNEKRRIVLAERLDDDAIRCLLRHGLYERCGDICRDYQQTSAEIKQYRQEASVNFSAVKMIVNEESDAALAQEVLMEKARELYPSLFADTRAAVPAPSSTSSSTLDTKERKSILRTTKAITSTLSKIRRLSDPDYNRLKYRIYLARNYLRTYNPPGDQLRTIVDNILEQGGKSPEIQAIPVAHPRLFSAAMETVRSFASAVRGQTSAPSSVGPVAVARNQAQDVSDRDFIAQLPALVEAHPILQRAADDVRSLVSSTLQEGIHRYSVQAAREAHKLSLEQLHNEFQLRNEAAHRAEDQERWRSFKQSVNTCLASIGTATSAIIIESVTESDNGRTSGSVILRGYTVHDIPPENRFEIHPLSLTQGDQHSIRRNPKHIPTPVLQESYVQSFYLRAHQTIRMIQRVTETRYLILVDSEDHCGVYLEDALSLSQTLAKGKPKKKIFFAKLLDTFVSAFDQARRMLAICGAPPDAPSDLQLQIYIAEEDFSGLSARGSPIKLARWYDETPLLHSLLFVTGTEELCFVEASGRVRVFSLVTEQFRPATIHLKHPPYQVMATPDGSCLLSVGKQDMHAVITAYHWASFGSNPNGLSFTVDAPPDACFQVTGLVSRSSVHVLVLSSHSIHSVILQIQHRSSEFTFKEREHEVLDCNNRLQATHNSLLDCHLDVWTRFPVHAAIQRDTISPLGRRPAVLIFVSDIPDSPFGSYYRNLVASFTRTIKKPTAGILNATQASAVASSEEVLLGCDISEFFSGQWMVELLCLIPLQLAITHQNRFVPLKDGVWSPEQERDLLGADVDQIIGALSLGWYESLFQSYMASKPVRVVSSMGEQSVGKSYSLNHFVDTSFAGSAMRTTEGVWMSVTPTKNAIIVALDFEGVHSLERSPQEDALLVLFNTAISNLVFFRNNFALSRDIAGLFTSFQSSSAILDPAANPTLFNGLLCIVIRDVVDSDTREIVHEFSLKFRQIVQDEQEENFISRLHRGKINIVPWPVINSPRFYGLFNEVKRQFERQEVTHGSAGTFLRTIKTLMAKLKANDWGALNQNLASYRAQHLSRSLSVALSHGASELEPMPEPLKDIDSDIEIPNTDTDSVFHAPYISRNFESDWDDRQYALRILIEKNISAIPQRHTVSEVDWMQQLQEMLRRLLEARFSHVRQWLGANTDRFRDHEDIKALIRSAEHFFAEMEGAVRLCGSRCAECHLSCLRPRHHPLSHDCQTSHRCFGECEMSEEHPAPVQCGLPAGHSSRHMCEVSAHSCGQPCFLQSRRGCLHSCSLPLDHEEPHHICSTRSHFCGEACALSGISLADGTSYTCSGRCTISWDEDHEKHICEHSHSCPLKCQLCNRQCESVEHLHGLDSTSIHLCGMPHPCEEKCELPGICNIETQPSKIVEEFQGRHETFSYTKYTQVARRLGCAVTIPPGLLNHAGAHKHSVDDKPFHFCQARCGQCEYFCTLPLGHPQTLHETFHGSMSAAKWMVDSADDTIELDGHKFGSGDDGGPMLCNLVCASQGRHAHLDFCRATVHGRPCQEPETEHITSPTQNAPGVQKKDWISHRLCWARLGFKDPYSKEEQAEFSKCDSMCSGVDHAAAASHPAQPSFCTLNIFHDPQPQDACPTNVTGYVSHDGHAFSCRNPVAMQRSFHVVFVVDSSGSMKKADRVPLPDAPSSARIRRRSNNRYGAVLSSLYAFWSSRQGAMQSTSLGARGDAYSVVTFGGNASTRVENDFTKDPDQLLSSILTRQGDGGTNFKAALQEAQRVIEVNWSPERPPVVIFLSDGECDMKDKHMRDLCNKANVLGQSLSFHAISFGPDERSATLRRMVEIARGAYKSGARDPLTPAAPSATEACEFSRALDTIQLAETFLGIAASLQKTRASLVRT